MQSVTWPKAKHNNHNANVNHSELLLNAQKLSDSSIQIGVFSAFIVIFISYAFHFYSYVFASFSCRAL